MINKMKHSTFLIFGVLWILFAGLTDAIADPENNQVVTSEEIRQKAEEYLMNQLNWDPESMEVDVKYKGEDLVLPEGELNLDYRMSANSSQIGRIPVSLQVKVDDRFLKRVRLSSQVEVYQDVVRLVNPVRRGEVLNNGDVAVDRVRSKRILRNLPNGLDEVVGMEATKNLKDGKIVTLRDLRKVPLVARGDRVILVIKKGSLKITTPGTVREDGFKNSIIQVVNLETKKPVYGEVIDANTVEVKY